MSGDERPWLYCPRHDVRFKARSVAAAEHVSCPVEIEAKTDAGAELRSLLERDS